MLSNDYVWDQSGDAEPDVRAWEQTLGTMRHRAPLRAPTLEVVDDPRSRVGWAKPVIFGALLSSALTVLLIWGFVRLGPGAPTPSIVGAETVAVSGPPPTSPATDRPKGSQHSRAAKPTDAGATTEARLEQLEAMLASIQTTLADLRKTIDTIEIRTRVPAKARTRARRDRPSVDEILGNTPPRRDPPSVDEILGVTRGKTGARRRTLSSVEIKAGIGPHKAAAKRCFREVDDPPAKVYVKLTIAGATGRITRAHATGAHAHTPLGQCVANAIKRARFPKFAKPSLGVQYPIRG